MTIKSYDFYNEYHLGDCVLHLYFCRKLVDYNQSQINFFVHQQYITELNFHILGYENNIHLKPLQDKPIDAINSWIGTDGLYYSHPESWDYNNFYLFWFFELSKKLNIPIIVYDMISDYLPIIQNVPEDSWDILYINSQGFSNGFIYDDDKYNSIAHKLSSEYKILTTQKIDGYECTRDYNWNLIQIAGAAIKCKYVIANHTSPIHLCFNKWSIDNIQHWFIIHTRDTFTFNNKIERISNYDEFDKIISYFNKGVL
jgi:hypothetical protein